MQRYEPDDARRHSFVPGRRLARALFDEIVQPVLANALPRLRYAAGLFGAGSDVLGFDTSRSMDHDWGPRCIILLNDADELEIGAYVRGKIAKALPAYFHGYPTLFQDAPDDPGVLVPARPERDAPLHHRVEVTTLQALAERYGFAPGDESDPACWLTISDQRLLELTSGDVFRDDTGELSRMRSALAFYPDDVWRYRMAAMWMRIAQIEPFVGRTGEVGDETGSHVIGARLVEDIMRLALSQARQYAPYSKWLGSALSRTEIAEELRPHLHAAREAVDWQAREAGVVAATSALVRSHNRLGLTPPLDWTPRPFHSRPFTVIGAERVANALHETLRDTPLGALPIGLGGIDQMIDSTDALNTRWLRQTILDMFARQMSQRPLKA